MFEVILSIILLSYLFVILVKFWFKTITKDCNCKDEYWFLDKKHSDDKD